MPLAFTAFRCLVAAALALRLLLGLPIAAAELSDSFSRGDLDTSLWNTCQADRDLMDFAIDAASGRDYLVMQIDGRREDGELCTNIAQRDLLAEPDALGPSLFVDAVTASAIAGLDCPRPEMRNGEAVIQRNELRFKSAALRHRVEHEAWYSLTFKLQGYGGDHIPECGSARWVIGQWKYEHLAPGSQGSPFLAQRFDNGVLHLTMEDAGCRCMIAKTGGDPDFTAAEETAALLPTPPLKCRYSEGPSIGQRCQPQHLRLSAADLATLSTLPDPRRRWVQMTYRIRAGGPQGSKIDIYANGRFILRAEGDIGPHIPGNRVKFKIGHYRDKIPVKAELLLDKICVSDNPKTCDRSIRPLP